MICRHAPNLSREPANHLEKSALEHNLISMVILSQTQPLVKSFVYQNLLARMTADFIIDFFDKDIGKGA